MIKPKGIIGIVLAMLALAAQPRLHAQVIFGFDPPFGTTNEQVIITGNGLAPGTLVVKFNGATDPTAQATSPTIIYARVPVGAITGPITVQVNSGSVSSVQDFKVLGRGPFITGFEPPYGTTNDQILIHGWHLTNATAVKFGGKNSTSFLPNAAGSQITATVPAGATNGPITVTTIYGTSNSVDSFTLIGSGPYVTGFFPAIGNAGDEIQIFGTNFFGATGVNFAGKRGVNFFVQGMGMIQVKAPAGVVTGPITILSPKGNFTTGTNFFVPPVVTGFSPASGRAGTNVVVVGQNLGGATALTIGGVPATSIISTNNTNVFAVVPLGVRSGPVRVNTPAGSSTTKSNFTVPPVLTGFAPAFEAPGATIILSGANLDEGQPVVKFGGINATVTQVAFDSLTVKVPNGAITAPVSITTTNGSFSTATNFFLPPLLSSFSPTNSAPGTPVTILGTNLLETSSVRFNGQEAEFSPVTNNNRLVATVPEGVITGPLSVTTPGGTAVIGTFYGKPRIDSFTPTRGLPGTMLTIVGTNFQQASQVKLGDLIMPGFQVSGNGGQINVQVPTNAVLSGKLSVAGPAGVGTSSANFVIDAESQLTITAESSSETVFVSSNLVYEILITNEGPSPAPNVFFETLLPASLQYKSFTISQGNLSFSNQLVRAELGLIPVTNSATITLTVAPTNAGTIITTGTVSSDYVDPQPGNNTVTISSYVLPLPFLTIARYSSSQLLIGWPVTLTNFILQYRNSLSSTSSWSKLNTPPSVVGTNFMVIEATAESDMRTYRLKQ